MKKMLLILSYFFIGYLILIISLFIFQRSFLYFPTKEKIDNAYFIDTGLNEIQLTTSDGLIILEKLPFEGATSISSISI